jgi:phosphate transport system permease protein
MSIAQQASRRLEAVIQFFLGVCALISILTTVGIIIVLVVGSAEFFSRISIREFFGTAEWVPFFEPRQFGIWPLVYGTLSVAFGAVIFAVPLGLGVAIYLAEYAPASWRRVLKPIVELLAGVPSVVYGYFALTTITPMLRFLDEDIEIFNVLSAAIVTGVMVLPVVASVCDDVLRAVPQSLRAGGFALGMTRFEVVKDIVLPSALSGVLAAFILAFSRAIGETMAVTLAAGATPQITWSPFESIQTMTAFIAQVTMGDMEHGTNTYYSIFAVGLLLFLVTLVMNMASHLVVAKFRRKYE